MTNVFGYIRVSTDDQTISLDAQRQRLEQWATDNGFTLAGVYTDAGISGGAPLDKRPALMEAIAALGESDVLVAVKRDRLARDAMYAAMIERLAERKQASVRTTDGVGDGDTPEAKLMRTMIDAFAEYERMIIKARTKAALAVKKARGEKLGGDVPYGFTVEGGKLIEDEDEQAMLKLIRRERANGLSLRAIAVELTRQGFLTRKATPFSAQQVSRILKAA